jgi:hypothetical protein
MPKTSILNPGSRLLSSALQTRLNIRFSWQQQRRGPSGIEIALLQKPEEEGNKTKITGSSNKIKRQKMAPTTHSQSNHTNSKQNHSDSSNQQQTIAIIGTGWAGFTLS